jgi:hypothetical protein
MRKERLEEHHILPKCICRALRLPRSFQENPMNKEMLTSKEHKKRHITTNEDLIMVKKLAKGRKFKETRIISKEVIVYERNSRRKNN